MPRHQLTDTQIKIRICPQSLRWPEPSAGSVWAAAHRCVDAWYSLVREVAVACTGAEQSHELSAGGIAQHRAEICKQALSKLVNFRPFEVAETALIREIDALEGLAAPNAQQSKMHQTLTKALKDLEEGLEATRRLVLDRCKTRERVSA